MKCFGFESVCNFPKMENDVNQNNNTQSSLYNLWSKYCFNVIMVIHRLFFKREQDAGQCLFN